MALSFGRLVSNLGQINDINVQMKLKQIFVKNITKLDKERTF